MYCKKCEKELNTNAKYCPECGSFLINKNSDNDDKNIILLCVGAFLIVLIAFIFSYESNKNGANSVNQNLSHNDNIQEAKLSCQKRITQLLASPTTAKFPSRLDFNVQDLGNSIYTVTSYVDAQNYYGVMLRSNWTCTVDLSSLNKVYFIDAKVE